MTSRARLLAVFAAGLVVGLIALLVATAEERVENIEQPPRARALANPFLAAGEFLKRQGLAVTFAHGPSSLPEIPATVFLPSTSSFDSRHLERWLKWCREGGHLIVALDHATTQPALLEAIGNVALRPLPNGHEATIEIGPLENAWDATLEVEMSFDQVLPTSQVDAMFAGAWLEDGIYWASYSQDQGFLTLLADDSFLTNGRIGVKDHAKFWWYLTIFHDWPEEVWIVLDDRPGLFRRIWHGAWPLLLVLSALLIFELWRRGSRFGPLQAERSIDRRGLKNHLEAAGHFLAQHREYAALQSVLRQETLRRAAQVQPGWEALNHRQRVSLLAALAHLPPAKVDGALTGADDGDPQRFATVIQILETIRRAL